LNGQGVHVGAKAGGLVRSARQMAENTRSTSQSGHVFNAGFLQGVLYDLAGAMFFIHQLGMSMKIMPGFDQLGQELINTGTDRSGEVGA
jgi:hypothetical protein